MLGTKKVEHKWPRLVYQNVGEAVRKFPTNGVFITVLEKFDLAVLGWSKKEEMDEKEPMIARIEEVIF